MGKTRKIQFVLLALTLLFIWAHSVLPTELSAEESEQVRGILRPVVEWLFGADSLTDDHPVRKAAHFLEFAALGAQLLLLLPAAPKSALKAGNYAFLAAFADESIQILSGRGDMIADVWLDLAGAACGMLFAAALRACLRAGRRRRRRA